MTNTPQNIIHPPHDPAKKNARLREVVIVIGDMLARVVIGIDIDVIIIPVIQTTTMMMMLKETNISQSILLPRRRSVIAITARRLQDDAIVQIQDLLIPPLANADIRACRTGLAILILFEVCLDTAFAT